MRQADRTFFYRNALEPLLAEEVERQMQQLPQKVIPYINPTQVLAYALNRLPAMYVTSERGWHLQQQRVKEKLALQIVIAVRQGLAAVQRDPLRVTTPFKFSGESFESQVQKAVWPEIEELPSLATSTTDSTLFLA